MSISILNRGASGGLKPELTVTAPSGSTIDLLQNGIIVATYTLGASETEHTFAVKVGMYTVRGTKGTQTRSVDVVIDAVGQYKTEFDYWMKLIYCGTDSGEAYYCNGYQYKSGKSGYSASDYAYFTFSQSSLYGGTNSGSEGCRFIQFADKVDFSEAKTAKMLAVLNNSTSTELIVRVSSAYNGNYDSSPLFSWSDKPQKSSSAQTVSIDLSDFDGTGYMSVRAKMTGCKILKIWLE